MSDLAEAHKRALSLIDNQLKIVCLDVECMSFRSHEIEVTETKMGSDARSVSIYIANESGEVSLLAYTWRDEKGEVTVKHNAIRLRQALDIMRRIMVIEDLADV